MIIITGAAGFIGSYLTGKLNRDGITDLHLVDDFSATIKTLNYRDKQYRMKTDRTLFPEWFEKHHDEVGFVFHIGARTDTTEFDMSVFDILNLNYSKRLWELCSRFEIPFIYASSAATYGAGELGYSDSDPTLSYRLTPLNPYGVSKNEFDKWALSQNACPPQWHGFKFFNVYGPNEYHKGRMASVIFHAHRQIRESGMMKLFRSHRSEYADGGQLRDFIYVRDVADVLVWFMQNRPESGIYNLGTGKARTFLDLATGVFRALDREPTIGFIDTPADIRDKYQYFTEADMDKLRSRGFSKAFTTLEEGIKDYVRNYLEPGLFF